MAENKKGFLLYANQRHIFDALTDEKRGALINHIFKYVNDELDEENHPDPLINMAFIAIKIQLKMDLKRWETTREKRSEAGKLGGRPKKEDENEKAKKANALLEKQMKAKKAVNVNGNVNVIVNDNIKKEINKEKRKSDFSKILQTHSENFDQSTINDFFDYWTEFGLNDKKMRFEKEKSFDVNLRLKTWTKNQKKWDVKKNTNQGARTHQENAGVLLLKKYGIR